MAETLAQVPWNPCAFWRRKRWCALDVSRAPAYGSAAAMKA